MLALAEKVPDNENISILALIIHGFFVMKGKRTIKSGAHAVFYPQLLRGRK